jgi:DNA repair protein RadC
VVALRKSKLYVLVKNLEGVNYDVELFKTRREAEREYKEYTGLRYSERYSDPLSEAYDKRFGETKIYELPLPDFLMLARKAKNKARQAQFDGYEYKGPKVKLKMVVDGDKKYKPMKMTKSSDVYSAFKKLAESDKERLYAVLLDSKNSVIGVELISQGACDFAPVIASSAFKSALLANAVGVIFVHNHPSGDPKPSLADIDVTNTLKLSGDLLGVRVLDHVIVGRRRYYSFADAGRMDKS